MHSLRELVNVRVGNLMLQSIILNPLHANKAASKARLLANCVEPKPLRCKQLNNQKQSADLVQQNSAKPLTSFVVVVDD